MRKDAKKLKSPVEKVKGEGEIASDGSRCGEKRVVPSHMRWQRR